MLFLDPETHSSQGLSSVEFVKELCAHGSLVAQIREYVVKSAAFKTGR
jgi:hypothetical protein